MKNTYHSSFLVPKHLFLNVFSSAWLFLMLFMKDPPILISNDTKTIKSNVKNFYTMLRINELVFNFHFIKNSSQNNPFSDGQEALV